MSELLANNRGKVFLLVVSLLFCTNAAAQTPNAKTEQQRGPSILLPEKAAGAGVGQARLQCAGYFRMPAMSNYPEIVGGEQEQEKTNYSVGDYIYINQGQQQGMKEGQELHIIRPHGEPIKVFREKSGYIGVFVEEIGQAKLVKVNPTLSVAQITFSCSSAAQLGDFLTGVPDRGVPDPHINSSFDRFTEPSSNTFGRVMMARDGRETVATGDVIYVDLGDEDKMVTGDYLTIYRPLGTGNLNVKVFDIAHRGLEGFESVQYQGGGFSTQQKRARQLNGGPPTTESQVRHKRQPMPSKVIGEAMIINVQTRTATAIITSVVQEIHTGDFVSPRK